MKEPAEPVRCLHDPCRLLVIRSGAIGDTIVMSVVYQALRRHFPRAYIEAIGQLERLRLIHLPGVIDAVTSIERSDIAAIFSPDLPLSSPVASYFQRFDRILVSRFDQDGALIKNLHRIHPGGILCFDPFPGNEAKEHVTRYLLRTLQALGIQEQEQIVPRIAVSEKSSSLHNNGPLRIALHPGSGSPAKNWPVEHFVALSLRLAHAFSISIHLVVGYADHALAQEFTHKVSRECPLKHLTQLPLVELAHELQDCSLYIGNDSGISHLAAALNVPTIAIFRTSNPVIWQPIGKHVLIFHDRSASGGEKITVDQVYARTVHFLSEMTS